MAQTRLNPLLRWARARHSTTEQPDFGDHGTAFGMELSMAPAAQAGEGSAAPVEPPARVASPAPAGGSMGMWRRLGGRRAWREG